MKGFNQSTDKSLMVQGSATPKFNTDCFWVFIISWLRCGWNMKDKCRILCYFI